MSESGSALPEASVTPQSIWNQTCKKCGSILELQGIAGSWSWVCPKCSKEVGYSASSSSTGSFNKLTKEEKKQNGF